MRTSRAWPSLLAVACQLGGPEGSPSALSEVEGGGRLDTEERATATDAGAPPRPEPPTSCAAPAGLLCDPVSGARCLPLTQCVVDPNASAAAAYCVLSGAPLGAACAQDPLSTTCPPQHTCSAGQCREYCYCDLDCDAGTACTDPSGQGGSEAFRLCAPAP